VEIGVFLSGTVSGKSGKKERFKTSKLLVPYGDQSTTKEQQQMETTQFAKQTLGFQKTILENSFNAMNTVQD
jgi:hypothetical protein